MVAKRCGSLVWSITPTDQPSASSQMLRQCLAVDLHVLTLFVSPTYIGSGGAAQSGAERGPP